MSSRKTVNLALQGGGAHGAFTWGVLDRMLDERDLEIEGISGTSAGAMNAAMVKVGMLTDGRKGAQAQLERFWSAIEQKSIRNTNPLYEFLSLFSEDLAKAVGRITRLPMRLMSDLFQRNVSPYEWNPLDIHPLRQLLTELTDERLCAADRQPNLFISATNVRTGQIRVFHDAELSPEVLLASACLPTLFQAVDIDGETYWDGGYTGNPALFPLMSMSTRDIVIVHINPIERETVPRDATAILNRVNEISFNTSLLRELRAIETVRELIEQGTLATRRNRDPLLHSIRNDDAMARLPEDSKIAPRPSLIPHLREEGRKAAEAFLSAHWDDLNTRNSLDLRALFPADPWRDG